MFIRRGNETWQRPPVQWYANEAEVQTLVADSPEVVGAAAAVVALREFNLAPAGAVNVLFEADGTVTLVEANLNRNSGRGDARSTTSTRSSTTPRGPRLRARRCRNARPPSFR